MTRNAIPFAILVLTVILALLAGCATYGYEFKDVDGTAVGVHDLSFLSRRDLADTASTYEWTADGNGNWKIGQSLVGTNSTEALPVIRDFFTAFFAAAGEAMRLYTATLGAGEDTADPPGAVLVSPLAPELGP